MGVSQEKEKKQLEPLRCKSGEPKPGAVCGTVRHIPCPLHHFCITRHVWSQEAGICCPSDRLLYRIYVEPPKPSTRSPYSEPNTLAETITQNLDVVVTNGRSASRGENNLLDSKIQKSVPRVINAKKTAHNVTKLPTDINSASRGGNKWSPRNIQDIVRNESTSTQATTVVTTDKETEVVLSQQGDGLKNSNAGNLKQPDIKSTTLPSTNKLSTASTTEPNQQVEIEEVITTAIRKAVTTVITTSLPETGAENAEHELIETNAEGFGGGNETQYNSAGEFEAENERVNNTIESTTVVPAATTVEQEAEEIHVIPQEHYVAAANGYAVPTEEPAEFETEYDYRPYSFWHYF